jgi:Tfp pilus assembly protein PilF
MLLASGDARTAYKEFEATLVTEPRRYRAVAGAMRSAKAAGNTSAAQRYAAQLAQLSEHGDRVGPR